MRKDKIIYDIKEAIRAYNKDAKITEAYIIHVVNTLRAKYIRQQQRRNPGESKVDYTQTMLLDLEVVDNSYLPEFPTNLTILRTKKSLPQLIGKEVLKKIVIRPIDRIHQEIEYMEKVRAIHASDPMFIFAFLDDDDKLYFVNNDNNLHKLLKRVAVSAILLEPDAITAINEEADDLVDYPIPGALWAIVKDEVMQNVLGTMQIAVDTVDDNQTQQ